MDNLMISSVRSLEVKEIEHLDDNAGVYTRQQIVITKENGEQIVITLFSTIK